MATMAQAAPGSEKVALGKLPMAALIGGGIGVVGNSIIYVVARALGISFEIPMGGPDAPLMELPIFAVIISTVVPTIGAAIVLALLGRFTKQPYRIFLIVSIVFLVLSFVTPLGLPLSLAGKLTLELMHVVAAAGIVWGLMRFSRA
jgi:hypothetical protein